MTHRTKSMPLLRVEWLDHCSFDKATWHSDEELKSLNPDAIISVGFLVNETDDAITLAAHVSSESATGEMCIIKGNIQSRKELK